MENHEKELLADAIHVAVIQTRKAIIYRRCICVLAGALVLSVAAIVSLMIWG